MSLNYGKEMQYPCPLESGGFARLWLPRNLTKEDARRLIAFIDALVIEPAAEEAGKPPSGEGR